MKNFIGGYLYIYYILYKKNGQREYEKIRKINDENKTILEGIKCLSYYKVSQYKYLLNNIIYIK